MEIHYWRNKMKIGVLYFNTLFETSDDKMDCVCLLLLKGLTFFLQGCWHCYGCCRFCTTEFHRDEQTLGSIAASGLWDICELFSALMFGQTWHPYLEAVEVKVYHKSMIFGHAGVMVLVNHSYSLAILSWGLQLGFLVCRDLVGLERSRKRREASYVTL